MQAGRDGAYGGLGADARARVLAAEEALDKGRLARGVLPEEEDHWLGADLGLGEEGRVKGVKGKGLFEGEDLFAVDVLEPVQETRRTPAGIRTGAVLSHRHHPLARHKVQCYPPAAAPKREKIASKGKRKSSW